MKLTRSLAFAVSALALSTSAAFAGGDAMSLEDQRHYQAQEQYVPYEHGGPQVLSAVPEPMTSTPELLSDEYSPQAAVPIEQPSEVPIEGDELS
jgi:hypothetical protein